MRVIVVSLSLALTGVLGGAGPAAALAPTPPRVDQLTHGLTVSRSGAGTAVLQDGRVFITGGQTGALGGGPEPTAELYDPGSDPVEGTFTSLGSTGSSRPDPFAATLDDGDVLIAGGYGGDAQRFTPPGTFTTLTGKTPASARNGATAARLPDGRILIVGGSEAQPSAEVFDPAANTFTLLTAKPGSVRAYAGSAELPDGRILIVGGSGGGPLDSAEVFDPVAGTFTTLAAKMSVARTGPAVAALPDGKVLVAGGAQYYACGVALSSSAEVFDPADEAFHALPVGMTVNRCSPSAATLEDGTVLLAGGLGDSAWLTSAERFVPAPSASVAGAEFSDRTVGSTSPEQTVTVRNLGAQDLEIGPGALSVTGTDAGDFTLLAETCTGRTLAFKTSCTLIVRFAPGAAGARTAQVQLDTNEPAPTAVTLSGTGVAPAPPAGPGTVLPIAAPVPSAPSGGVKKPAPTCRVKRLKKGSRITCAARFPKQKRKAIKLMQGKKVVARGRVDRKGRVTLTTFLRPKAGTYRLRVGTTSVVVKLR